MPYFCMPNRTKCVLLIGFSDGNLGPWRMSKIGLGNEQALSDRLSQQVCLPSCRLAAVGASIACVCISKPLYETGGKMPGEPVCRALSLKPVA
jgi:hypothetical protein